MKNFFLYIITSFLFSSICYAETYTCMYEFNNETRLKILKRQGKTFVDEEGDVAGKIFLENDESIIITQYYPYMDKDYPQIIFVTHIDKLKSAFSMSGLKYPNPTNSISGKCKIMN